MAGNWNDSNLRWQCRNFVAEIFGVALVSVSLEAWLSRLTNSFMSHPTPFQQMPFFTEVRTSLIPVSNNRNWYFVFIILKLNIYVLVSTHRLCITWGKIRVLLIFVSSGPTPCLVCGRSWVVPSWFFCLIVGKFTCLLLQWLPLFPSLPFLLLVLVMGKGHRRPGDQWVCSEEGFEGLLGD